MVLRQRYRLELHWDKVSYHNESLVVLENAFFSGPALKIAAKIESGDHIDLDMTPQHLHVLGSYYIVRLSWKDVRYNEEKVFLSEAVLENPHLKTLHKLEHKDFISIDTYKHEEATHSFHLVYSSTVMKSDKDPHKYTLPK